MTAGCEARGISLRPATNPSCMSVLPADTLEAVGCPSASYSLSGLAAAARCLGLMCAQRRYNVRSNTVLSLQLSAATRSVFSSPQGVRWRSQSPTTAGQPDS